MLFNKRCPHCGAFPIWQRIFLPGSSLHHWLCDNCSQPLRYDPASLAVAFLAGCFSFVAVLASLYFPKLGLAGFGPALFGGWFLGAVALTLILKTVQRSTLSPHRVPTYFDGSCGACGALVSTGWKRIRYQRKPMACSCGAILKRTNGANIPVFPAMMLFNLPLMAVLEYGGYLISFLFVPLIAIAISAISNPLQVIEMPIGSDRPTVIGPDE